MRGGTPTLISTITPTLSNSAQTISLSGHNKVYVVLTGYRYGAQNIVNEYDGNRNILINESNSVNSNIQLWELTGSTYISFKSWSHGDSVMSALIYAID